MLTPQKKRYKFSPELAAQIESQMAQGRVASSDATTRISKPTVNTKVKYKLKPGEMFFRNPNGTVTLVQGKNETVQQDNRTQQQRKQDQKSAQYKRKIIQQEKANQEAATAASEMVRRIMPSSVVRAAYDATTGDKSFVGSMVEGNKGLGNEALNLMFDMAAPVALAKGVRYASEAIPKFARFGVSNHTGNWTQFGNNMYRLKPGYVGMNGNPIQRKPLSEVFEWNHWNRFRNPKYVTETDKIELESHMPEYKAIQERAMDEGNYMIVPEGFPMSKQLNDGRFVFTGPEGAWIQSQSKAFQNRFKNQKLKIGFKGGQDQKIEGIENTHAPETFPHQDNGVFFTGVQQYANRYNNGEPSPGFWLGFRRPYDMLEGGKKPFLLEDNNVRFVRSVEASPSFKGEFPDQTFKTLHNVWNSEFINNPETMKLLTTPLEKLTPEQFQQRYNLLLQIRQGQSRKKRDAFLNMLNSRMKSGQYQPIRGNYYDGYIGRDHAFGLGEYNGIVKDEMWPFGSFPETYVIKNADQAALLEGNNGAFNGPTYSRKQGGKMLKTK